MKKTHQSKFTIYSKNGELRKLKLSIFKLFKNSIRRLFTVANKLTFAVKHKGKCE